MIAANELGGLAAPSIATIRADRSDFDNFGEISLLADPSLLESEKARTFDADIYSPRQPRPEFDINYKAYTKLIDEISDGQPEGLRLPDESSLDTAGAEAIQRSTAAQYFWLKEQGKAPKLKKKFKIPNISPAL